MHHSRTPRRTLLTCASERKWIQCQRGLQIQGSWWACTTPTCHDQRKSKPRECKTEQTHKGNKEFVEVQPAWWQPGMPLSGIEMSLKAVEKEDLEESVPLSRVTLQFAGLLPVMTMVTSSRRRWKAKVVSDWPTAAWVTARETSFTPAAWFLRRDLCNQGEENERERGRQNNKGPRRNVFPAVCWQQKVCPSNYGSTTTWTSLLGSEHPLSFRY